MNYIEMKMYDEYMEKLQQQQSCDYFKPKTPTHEDKQYWLKNNVDYNTLIEYAFDNPIIVSTLYEHFKK